MSKEIKKGNHISFELTTGARKITTTCKIACLFRAWANDNVDKIANVTRKVFRDLDVYDSEDIELYKSEIKETFSKIKTEKSIGGFIMYLDKGNLDEIAKIFAEDSFMNDKKGIIGGALRSFAEIFKFLYNCSDWYEYLDVNPRKMTSDIYEIEYGNPHNYEKLLSSDKVSNKTKYKLYMKLFD